jgi:hypothetical protein
MARLSWREGMEVAEREAWRTKGKKHSDLFVYGRFIPWVLGAVVLGALGYGAKWAWDRLTAVLGSNTDTAPGAAAHAGVPSWVWMAGIVLAIATVLVLRGRAYVVRGPGVMLAIVAGVAIVWLGFIAFILGTL